MYVHALERASLHLIEFGVEFGDFSFYQWRSLLGFLIKKDKKECVTFLVENFGVIIVNPSIKFNCIFQL